MVEEVEITPTICISVHYLLYFCVKTSLLPSNLIMQRKGKTYLLSTNMFSSHGNIHEIKMKFLLMEIFFCLNYKQKYFCITKAWLM